MCMGRIWSLFVQEEAQDALRKLDADIEAKQQQLNEVTSEHGALADEVAELNT